MGAEPCVMSIRPPAGLGGRFKPPARGTGSRRYETQGKTRSALGSELIFALRGAGGLRSCVY